MDENEIDFWVEADLILSDVESSFQAGGVPENANQLAPPGKECQGSVSVDEESSFQGGGVPENANQVAPPGKECQGSVSVDDDDSIFENLDDMSFSDVHSAAAVNQGSSFMVSFDSLEYFNTLSCFFQLLCYFIRHPSA